MALSDRFNILAALGFPTDQDAAIELRDKNEKLYSIVADSTSTGLLIEGGKLTIDSGGLVITADGITVTAGGVTVTAGGLTVTAGGLTVTAGGAVVTAGGLEVTAGGFALKAGRTSEVLSIVDDDSQNMTLAAADVLAGINVHTSTSSGGTVTTDTAVNLVSGIPLDHDGQAVVSYYVNDGSQTVTFAGGTGVTVSDTGNTALINTSKLLLWVRTDATNVVLHIIG